MESDKSDSDTLGRAMTESEEEKLKKVLDLAGEGETQKLGEFLARNKIPPSIRDESGWSPLIMAAKVEN